MASHDVIVIGSGIGGLTAALCCARADKNVLVLEAAKQIGGYINPFARKRFDFDTGIHYIGDCGPGQSLYRHFERLGLTETLRFRELCPDGFDRYVFPGYEISMCKGADRYRDRLIRDFPNEASGLTRFFALLAEVDEAMRAATRVRGPRTLWPLVRRIPVLAKCYRATFRQVVDGLIEDERLKSVLAGPGGDIGLPPGRASALIMMAVLSHYLRGAYFPVGGTRAVRDAYVDALKAHGATLERNTPVAKILVRDDKVAGVRTDSGVEHSAPVVISNAPAVTTLRDMLGGEHLSPSLSKKVNRARYSLGTVCAFVGTDLQPEDYGLSDANIWHYPTWDIDRLYEPAARHELGEEISFFLTVPTLKDPSGCHAPAGKHTVELISCAPWRPFARWKDQPTLKRDEDYASLKAELGDKLLAAAEAHLPGLRDHMEVCEVATPLTNTSFVKTIEGSIYGLEHTPDQVVFGRFRTAGPVEGLYLCGADVLGAGIATCVTSGAMAARAAMAEPSRLEAGLRRASSLLRLRQRVPA